MILRCSWCGKTIGEIAPAQPGISHGVCQSCKARILTEFHGQNLASKATVRDGGPERSGNMKIEYDSEDLKKVENSLAEIKSLAMRARLGTESECRQCLKDVILQANVLTNLLLNGVILDEVELSR
jgi:DNA-directed RNA polymerase subunit RPC12/RpoP